MRLSRSLCPGSGSGSPTTGPMLDLQSGLLMQMSSEQQAPIRGSHAASSPRTFPATRVDWMPASSHQPFTRKLHPGADGRAAFTHPGFSWLLLWVRVRLMNRWTESVNLTSAWSGFCWSESPSSQHPKGPPVAPSSHPFSSHYLAQLAALELPPSKQLHVSLQGVAEELRAGHPNGRCKPTSAGLTALRGAAESNRLAAAMPILPAACRRSRDVGPGQGLRTGMPVT